jgi:hypothetical protein
MPVVVSGVKQLQKAMKNVDPALNKQMKSNIRSAMIPIRNNARGYMPSTGEMLSGWTKASSSLNTLKYRPFPHYDQSVAQKGIVYREGQNKRNNSGFKAVFYVANTSAAGAIYETAGRKNPSGDPKSESNNPNAGRQFIGRAGGLSNMKGLDKQRGRALYRAWAEDQGRVIAKVVMAIQSVAIKFNKDTELRKSA